MTFPVRPVGPERGRRREGGKAAPRLRWGHGAEGLPEGPHGAFLQSFLRISRTRPPARHLRRHRPACVAPSSPLKTGWKRHMDVPPDCTGFEKAKAVREVGRNVVWANRGRKVRGPRSAGLFASTCRILWPRTRHHAVRLSASAEAPRDPLRRKSQGRIFRLADNGTELFIENRQIYHGSIS